MILGGMACGTAAYTMTLGMMALGGMAFSGMTSGGMASGRTARVQLPWSGWYQAGLLGLTFSNRIALAMMGLTLACARVVVVGPNEEASSEADNVLNEVADNKIDTTF